MFLLYMDLAAILFSGTVVQNHLNKQTIPFNSKPHVKSDANWSSGFREDYMILYVYTAQTKITTGGQNFDCN